MKTSRKKFALVGASIGAFMFSAFAQGTFQNLDFESANVAGATRGDPIAASAGMPGWSVSGSLLYYDVLALSSPVVGINDQNTGLGFEPLQGSFSAYLAGGEGSATAISQTGLVPVGTKSIFVDVQTTGFNLITTLDGQTIAMQPVSVNSGYTVYGGDVSAFANGSHTLAFTEPNTPNALGIATLDNIIFSTNAIPEPAAWALMLCGAGFLGVMGQRRKA